MCRLKKRRGDPATLQPERQDYEHGGCTDFANEHRHTPFTSSHRQELYRVGQGSGIRCFAPPLT